MSADPATPNPPRTHQAARRFLIQGTVQGVGFRPFVARLATRLGLHGSIRNASAGVIIHVEGPEPSVTAFTTALSNEAPRASRIESIIETREDPRGASTFQIELSGPALSPSVRVPRDLAICAECASDIADPNNRRNAYPFTNCTACGPRFTILDGLPYDRTLTTMTRFTMCPICATEYADPSDRRFHAEPNACPTCGPGLALWDQSGTLQAHTAPALTAAIHAIRDGEILALKGLGGFQFLVRADREDAVQRLRTAKHRPTKPLALMVADITAARTIGILSPDEERALLSPENPIVLIERLEAQTEKLAKSVAPQVSRIGLMLPTTPLHLLIARAINGPLVATSGNRGDEPIVTSEASAVSELGNIADQLLVHDRPIAHRADDSVVQIIAGHRQVVRLARGLAPWPLGNLERWIARHGGAGPVLAVGGQQKVALAFWSGEQAVLGPHIGDLDTPQARADLEHQTQSLTDLYRFTPHQIACDLHPDYVTTRWAECQGLPTVPVQHHHAHAVATMLEHDLLDDEVLALCWDGTGYGLDGTIWGAELLRTQVDGFERVASLRPLALPGGEAAIREPWRIALVALADSIGPEAALRHPAFARLGIEPDRARTLLHLAQRNIATVWASSIGRLFDAVAALVLGIKAVSHEGEAAAWLESVSARDEIPKPYEMPIVHTPPSTGDPLPRGDWRPMLREIANDLQRGVHHSIIAARFHKTLACWAAQTVTNQRDHAILLSGGCWVNQQLAQATIGELESIGRRAYLAASIPPNDGGLSAGQLAVAVARQVRHRA